MLAAKSEVQIDNDEVRVTEWRLAPGSATGHHTHGMDYVIVPIVAAEMTIVAPSGERSKAQLSAEQSKPEADRDKAHRRRPDEATPAFQTPPCAQQIRIHVMSRRYRPDAGAGLSRLRNDP